MDANTDCPVCLEPFAGVPPEAIHLQISCSHKVCLECWSQWAQRQQNPPCCPLCRRCDVIRGPEPRRIEGVFVAVRDDDDADSVDSPGNTPPPWISVRRRVWEEHHDPLSATVADARARFVALAVTMLLPEPSVTLSGGSEVSTSSSSMGRGSDDEVDVTPSDGECPSRPRVTDGDFADAVGNVRPLALDGSTGAGGASDAASAPLGPHCTAWHGLCARMRAAFRPLRRGPSTANRRDAGHGVLEFN